MGEAPRHAGIRTLVHRFDNTARRLGLDLQRSRLRTDLFVGPSAAPAAPPVRSERPERPERRKPVPPVAEQLSLI